MTNRHYVIRSYLMDRCDGLFLFAGTLKQLGKILRPLGGLYAEGDLSLIARREGFPKIYSWRRNEAQSFWLMHDIIKWIASNLCLQYEHFEPVKGDPDEPPDCSRCVYYGKRDISRRKNKCRCASSVGYCEELYCHYSGIALDLLNGIFWRVG